MYTNVTCIFFPNELFVFYCFRCKTSTRGSSCCMQQTWSSSSQSKSRYGMHSVLIQKKLQQITAMKHIFISTFFLFFVVILFFWLTIWSINNRVSLGIETVLQRLKDWVSFHFENKHLSVERRIKREVWLYS